MIDVRTLTQVQEDAIHYLMTRHHYSHRVGRVACRMVRSYCREQGYTEAETNACVRDMLDMYKLESNAE